MAIVGGVGDRVVVIIGVRVLSRYFSDVEGPLDRIQNEEVRRVLESIVVIVCLNDVKTA